MTSTPPTTPPNILLILDDQHRFDYLGCAGADWVSTPNIDRLAQRGTRFTSCTVNSPICAPSRISLATGMLAHRVAPYDNASFLSHTQTTYYQRLRDHGYRVGCVGKLDLGKPDTYNGRYGDRPMAYSWGFTHPEECEGKMHAAHFDDPVGPYTHFLQERGLFQEFCADYRQRMNEAPHHKAGASQWVETGSDDSVLPTDAFEDTYIGQRAARWIENVPDDFPWHYFVSFVGPHDPFDPPAEYAERYRNGEMPAAIPHNPDGRPGWIQQRSLERDPETVAMVRRQYCALIELIDHQIGMILDALEKRGMAENTIVIFASDHGEMLGDHGLLYKGCRFFEGLVHVPLIISWPGHIRENIRSSALVELVDIAPTLLEASGLAVPTTMQGQSLWPLLTGTVDADTHKAHVISEFNDALGSAAIPTPSHGTMYFDGRMKHIVHHGTGLGELYDLAIDPGEFDNLFDDPSRADERLDLMRRHFDALMATSSAGVERGAIY